MSLDLPDLTAACPDVALIPILSDVRGVTVVMRKWMRKHRLPDAIVVEHPRYAGGQFGEADEAEVLSERFDFERGLFFRGAGKLPFGSFIGHVEELIRYLVTGEYPDGLQAT